MNLKLLATAAAIATLAASAAQAQTQTSPQQPTQKMQQGGSITAPHGKIGASSGTVGSATHSTGQSSKTIKPAPGGAMPQHGSGSGSATGSGGASGGMSGLPLSPRPNSKADLKGRTSRPASAPAVFCPSKLAAVHRRSRGLPEPAVQSTHDCERHDCERYVLRDCRAGLTALSACIVARFANRSSRSLAMFFRTAMSLASYSARAFAPSSAACRRRSRDASDFSEGAFVISAL